MAARITSDTEIGIDPYGFAGTHLSPAARRVLANLRSTLERDVQPLLADAWEHATMPSGVIDALRPLNLMRADGLSADEADSSMFSGFRNYVLARTDPSVATHYNAQAGLFRTAVRLGGSAEQASELGPRIRAFDLTGAFALTEPDHGSDIAGGLATTAQRHGDTWRINGMKRWIGAASSADVIVVFARDTADDEIKAFLVPRGAAGVSITPITGKIALRPMQNAEITLTDVTVDERSRLKAVHGWPDVAHILRATRADVAWIAAGVQAGALEATLRYAAQRSQFGRSISGFQLTQERLARMLGNLVSSLGIVVQLSARQDAGDLTDENSALAKLQTSRLARESVALGREVLGGNGILLEHDIARFFADTEAVYSYEGTHDINSLIVGRALTGTSAFA